MTTDVYAEPLSPRSQPSYPSIDDFLDLGQAADSDLFSHPSSGNAALNSLSEDASADDLFRYYLEAEVKKIGADPAVAMDWTKYLHQHSSPDTGSATSPNHASAASSATFSPLDHVPGDDFSSSATLPGSIDPHLVTSPAPSTSKASASVQKPSSSLTTIDEYDGSTGFAPTESEMAASDVYLSDGVWVTGGTAGKRSTGGVPPSVSAAADLRPSPEEYKKLSSKEKRQLRNKISARNFRSRRKEYITMLEEQVADRDRIIDMMRSELSQVKLENLELKEEMNNLKTKIISSSDITRLLEGLRQHQPPTSTTSIAPAAAPTPASEPIIDAVLDEDAENRPLSAIPTNTESTKARPASPACASPSASPLLPNARAAPVRRSSPLPKANVSKDLPNTTAGAAARPFWGGAAGSFGGNAYMPVHATFVPEVNLGQKGVGASPRGFGVRLPTSGPDFFDLNPFTFKDVDDYRYHLYRTQLFGKAAAASAVANMFAPPQDGQQPTFAQVQAGSAESKMQYDNATSFDAFGSRGLAGSLKPAYFSSPGRGTTAILSGKEPHEVLGGGGLPTPKETKGLVLSRDTLQQERELRDQHFTLLANMATSTLVNRMFGAFWDAFAGQQSLQEGDKKTSVTSFKTRPVNPSAGDRVAAVLDGRAEVRVVDKKSGKRWGSAEKASSCSSEDALADRMADLSLGSKTSSTKETSGAGACQKQPSCGGGLRSLFRSNSLPSSWTATVTGTQASDSGAASKPSQSNSA